MTACVVWLLFAKYTKESRETWILQQWTILQIVWNRNKKMECINAYWLYWYLSLYVIIISSCIYICLSQREMLHKRNNFLRVVFTSFKFIGFSLISLQTSIHSSIKLLWRIPFAAYSIGHYFSSFKPINYCVYLRCYKWCKIHKCIASLVFTIFEWKWWAQNSFLVYNFDISQL